MPLFFFRMYSRPYHILCQPCVVTLNYPIISSDHLQIWKPISWTQNTSTTFGLHISSFKLFFYISLQNVSIKNPCTKQLDKIFWRCLPYCFVMVRGLNTCVKLQLWIYSKKPCPTCLSQSIPFVKNNLERSNIFILSKSTMQW